MGLLRGYVVRLFLLTGMALVITGIAFAGPDEFADLVTKKGPAVREVLDKPTIFRVAELPGLPCSGRTFEFLLDRPRLSMLLARTVDGGLDTYKMETLPDGSLRVKDDNKLTGSMELVSAGYGSRTYYLAGSWRMMPGVRINGRMVLVPEYKEKGLASGPEVDARVRGYIKVDNRVAGYLARVVAYLFPAKVDARIGRFTGAVRRVAAAVHDDPAGVYKRLVARNEAAQTELDEYRDMFLKGDRR